MTKWLILLAAALLIAAPAQAQQQGQRGGHHRNTGQHYSGQQRGGTDIILNLNLNGQSRSNGNGYYSRGYAVPANPNGYYYDNRQFYGNGNWNNGSWNTGRWSGGSWNGNYATGNGGWYSVPPPDAWQGPLPQNEPPKCYNSRSPEPFYCEKQFRQ